MALRRAARVIGCAIALCAAFSMAADAAAQTVTIVDFSFSPQTKTVNVGDTVTWQNTGAATHSATSDTPGIFDTLFLSPGMSSRPIAFAVAGPFAYHCAIHSTMHGTIVVVGPTPTPVPPTPAPTPRPTPPPTPAPTVAPTAPPTAPPTASPSPSPSPTTSPSGSPSPTPSPTATSTGTPIAVPSSVAAASPAAAGGAGPALGSGPGTLIAIGGLALAAALGGIALYLYRRR